MLRRIALSFALFAGVLSGGVGSLRADAPAPPYVIVPGGKATFLKRLAVQEIRRYWYLRTGQLIPVGKEWPAEGTAIAVGTDEVIPFEGIRPDDFQPRDYVLSTFQRGKGSVALVTGGSDVGTLYAAYRFCERLGVRFYLHGDVIPDRRMAPVLPEMRETGRPLFEQRGIQPFHDFPEGPDWWNADGYKAVLAQLPKLRMNFFGLHTYPEGGVGPEPLVWIGLPEDIGQQAAVKFSYPSRHFTAANGTWGYRPVKTGEYAFGAGSIFDCDDYGVDYMRGMTPWPPTPADCNVLFQRMGNTLADTFALARRLGIKTCVGTETPLVVPKALRERLKAMGKDPTDPAVVQKLYEGLFQRIAATHPLDYYWFWTPEGWTWQGAKQKQVDTTVADLKAAIAAAEKVKAPFTLATCGWVLGPQQDRALFDRMLPKSMPMSCISRDVGHDPVEPGFAKVAGRPKWAIPWMEDDPSLTSVQLWAGRMRRDAADARAYGCTGLMGIHWRTRVLGPNVASLARAAWDQTGWNPRLEGKPMPPAEGKPRQGYLPVGDFYADWAAAEFGPEAAPPLAALFTKLDGHLPVPTTWVQGPGGINPDNRPWSAVAPQYAFVDEMAAIQPQVQGPGSRERFAYWLDSFQLMRANAQLNCAWGQYQQALKEVQVEKEPAVRKRLARETLLPIRKEMIGHLRQLHRHLLATLTTTGEMGNLTNWQQHVMPLILGNPGKELAKLLGEDLPADAMPSSEYPAPPRLFVPVVRTSLMAGEPLRLTAVLAGAEAKEITLLWRPMGMGDYRKVPLEHVARGVYRVTLPGETLADDFEYYIEAATTSAEPLRFPVTAPQMNQTVVVLK
jgi:hypothetical protein